MDTPVSEARTRTGEPRAFLSVGRMATFDCALCLGARGHCATDACASRSGLTIVQVGVVVPPAVDLKMIPVVSLRGTRTEPNRC